MKGKSIVPDERQDAGVYYETFGPQNLIVLNDAVMVRTNACRKLASLLASSLNFLFSSMVRAFPSDAEAGFLKVIRLNLARDLFLNLYRQKKIVRLRVFDIYVHRGNPYQNVAGNK